MNAHDIIDCYVADVVRRLPRRQRRDVGAELRSLLTEELTDRRADRPDGNDEQLVRELLRGFGRPAEAAARYRPPLVLIDPADSRALLKAAVIGVAIVWGLGAVAAVRSGHEFLDAARDWWLGAALPAFAWPGLLLTFSALAAWTRRRWPARAEWKPRTARERRDEVSRPGYLALMALAVAGAGLIIRPDWLLDALFGGTVPEPAARAFAYDESFVDVRAPWLIGLGGLQLALYLAIVVRGRWDRLTRWIDTALTLAVAAVIGWVVAAGSVFQARPTDDTMKAAMLLAVAFAVGGVLLRIRRDRRRLAPGRELSRIRRFS